MGVITLATIAAETVFGPISTVLTLTDPATLIGHMTSDNRPDIHTVKMDLMEYSDGVSTKEWVPYVQAARDVLEQNMEAFVRDGQLHYRSTRTIAAGEHVLVWYSKELAERLGVPELRHSHFNKSGEFCCPSCGETFKYPYSLRAHLRFRCSRQEQRLMPPATAATHSLGYMAPLFAANRPPPNPLRSPPTDMSILSSPTSSSGESSSYSSNLSPSRDVNGKSPSPSSRKRSRDSRQSPAMHKRRRESDTVLATESALSEEENSPPSSPKNYSIAQLSKSDNKVDQNQNIDQDDALSAFRKVSKLTRDDSPPPFGTSSAQQHNRNDSLGGGSFAPAPMTSHRFIPGIMDRKEMPGLPPAPPVFGRFSMVPSVPLTGMYHAPHLGNDSLSAMNMNDLYRNSVNKTQDLVQRMAADRLTEMRGNEPGGGGGPMLAPKAMPNANIGVFKSANPMVERLLASTATPLGLGAPAAMTLQNWCAKCNATFRMTSDLVYHMRSHHSEHQDTTKKKREDKLHCDVCGETFRERHHLTRHMSSHA